MKTIQRICVSALCIGLLCAATVQEKFYSQNIWLCVLMARTGWSMSDRGYSEQDATNMAVRIYNHDTNGQMEILKRGPSKK